MNGKKELREFYLKIRNSMTSTERRNADGLIYERFINSLFFKNSDTFLVYISVRDEVGTENIIQYLLDNNKNVAVPYCYDKSMDFYYIHSTDDLTEGKFGIPTVDIQKSVKVENSDNALCIVPAISFDNNGNRLGYGGGFYDRFLAKNNVLTVGLCYQRCICDVLPTEETDIKIDYVLTETNLWNHKN